MRTAKDILALVRNGLAIYGTYCILSEHVSKRIEKSWDKIVDRTEEKLHEFIYGEPKEKIIEVDYEEVE